MEYISAKEAADIWGVSSRYVTKLAASGRLEGAKLIGNSWMIPKGITRPKDGRQNVPQISFEEHELFCLPAILYRVRSIEQVANDFSDEEKKLFNAFMAYESGNFENSCRLSDQLIGSSKNPFIKIGAYYNASLSYIFLEEFDTATKYFSLYHLIATECDDEHRRLLEPVIHDFDCSFLDSTYFIENFSFDFTLPFPMEVMPYYHSLSVYSDSFSDMRKSNGSNITAHVISCIGLERLGYFYPAMIMNWTISKMFLNAKNVPMSEHHLKKAIDIAIEHNTFTTLSKLLLVYYDVSLRVLSSYPEYIQKKFHRLIDLTISTGSKYLSFCESSTILARLSGNDYKFLSYLFQGLTYKEIAERENIGISTVRNRVMSLRKKFHASSAAEVVDMYKKHTLSGLTELHDSALQV